jgi:hypothetical protein
MSPMIQGGDPEGTGHRAEDDKLLPLHRLLPVLNRRGAL